MGGVLAAALNYLGGFLNNREVISLFFDSIGTVGFTLLAGPMWGLIPAIVYPLLVSVTYFNGSYYFIPIHIMLLLITWGAKKLGWFKNAGLAILAGVISAVLVFVAAWPAVAFVYTDPADRTFNTFIDWFTGSIGREIIDKPLVFLIVWGVYYLLKDKIQLKEE